MRNSELKGLRRNYNIIKENASYHLKLIETQIWNDKML